MKEKTADTEGHRIKVGLDQQHKSTSSSSSGKVNLPVADSAIVSSSKQETSSKNPLFGVANNSNQSNNSNNGGSNNNNFDDDYNEWDISIGDLIIDLDADIEQSEGDKAAAAAAAIAAAANCASKSENNTKTLLEGAQPTVSLPNPKLFPDISDSVSVMSSNLKSNRSSSLSSGASAHSSLSASNSNSSLISAAIVVPAATAVAVVAPNVTSTNGANSVPPPPPPPPHGPHHGGINQRNAYPVSANNSAGVAANIPVAVTKNSMVEHQATVDKGLKMKIKRKSIGGKISETKHEIVSSDISPQACKPYVGGSPFDPPSSNGSSNSAISMPNLAANQSPDSNHGLNSTNLNSSNSVITANTDGVAPTSSLGDLPLLSTKPSKHSSKNKSAHRDKKDKEKNKCDKDKICSPVIALPTNPLKAARPAEETQDTAAAPTSTPTLPLPSSSSSQPGIPNLTLKYSTTLSPTVILKHEELNRNAPNSNNPKKIKTDNVDDNISERRTVGTSTSISTITEPDCLGPCEPGTSVTLEGIVWQETEGGVLVVNVTWRGKTYVGTLLDCTKHDWAPPRFCESPTSDIESKSLKNTRGKRARNSFATDTTIDTRSVTSKLRNGKGRRTANSGYVPPSPAKSDSSLSNNNTTATTTTTNNNNSSSSSSSKRKGRPGDLDLSMVDDTAKRNRLASAKPDTPDVQAPCSPVLIECPEPNCSKKYKHINGLKYHQSHAHIGSTFNINDSQEYDNSSEVAVKDDSDGELNDSSLPEFGLKENSNGSDKVIGSDAKMKADGCDSIAGQRTFANTLNTISHSFETRKLKSNNNSANDQLVAGTSTTSSNLVIDKSVDMFDMSRKSGGDAFANAPKEKHRLTDSDSALNDLPSVLGADCVRGDSVNNRNVIFSSNGIDLSSGLGKSLNSALSKDADEEIKNVASPAYSDISDDMNANDSNPNELATLASSQPLLEKGDASVDLKKPPPQAANNNFNLSPFHPFFNQSQYLPPGSNTGDLTKPAAAAGNSESTLKTPSETSEPSTLTADKQNLYASHPFFRSMAPHDPPKSAAESLAKSGALHSTSSPTNVNKTDSSHFLKDKRDNDSMKPASKENSDFNAGPLYDPQKRYISEGDKERSSKEKAKHSPQQGKPQTLKEDKDKPPKSEEGVKPTMETTGPPPPTNGYYYNPTFLPHSFPQMGVSPFDNMLRANHMVMGSPFGPPPGASQFLHSQMRFPPMGPMDGLSLSNAARSSAQSPSSGPSTSTTSAKSSSSAHHHLSSSFPANSKADRTILSPTSNSASSSSSSHQFSSANSYHKSPSKDYPGSLIPSSHGVVPTSASDPRTSMAGPSSSLHQPRHPMHAAPHVSFPMYDPYVSMIVNHASNSVPMHPFVPK